MSDIHCPYCSAEQEISHDDGSGYAEDESHQQQCSECEKCFVFTTHISFLYSPHKADCLNGAKHNWKLSKTYPCEFSKWICTDCGEEQALTKSERHDLLSGAALTQPSTGEPG